MAEPPPTYTREEMDAILKRAIERQQTRAEEIDHEDLVAAAGEVGIPREEVEAAARDLQAEKAAKASPRESAAGARPTGEPREGVPDSEERARAIARFKGRVALYALLSVLFFYIAQVVTHDTWWVWPVLGFSIALGRQANRLFFADPAREKERARRPTREERRRARRAERREDFERTVAFGADALVKVIEEARNVKARLDEQARARREPERPAQGPRVIITPPPADAAPGVRIDAREHETVGRDAEDEDRERRNRGA